MCCTEGASASKSLGSSVEHSAWGCLLPRVMLYSYIFVQSNTEQQVQEQGQRGRSWPDQHCVLYNAQWSYAMPSSHKREMEGSREHVCTQMSLPSKVDSEASKELPERMSKAPTQEEIHFVIMMDAGLGYSLNSPSKGHSEAFQSNLLWSFIA